MSSSLGEKLKLENGSPVNIDLGFQILSDIDSIYRVYLEHIGETYYFRYPTCLGVDEGLVVAEALEYYAENFYD